MKVVKVIFDSCDSWSGNTRRLEVIAKDTKAAIKFIAIKENKTEEKISELMAGYYPYWTIEEVEVYE